MYFHRKRDDGNPDLALVWCLTSQSVAAVGVGAVAALTCNLQDGPAEETATAAALESGCCSAAAI